MARKSTALIDLPLTPQQEAAIAALVAGKTPSEADAAAQAVAGSTAAWLDKDPRFVAALNRRRQELWDAHAQRLAALRGKALDVLENMLDTSADPNALLKAAGMIVKAAGAQERPTGPTTPAGAEREQTLRLW